MNEVTVVIPHVSTRPQMLARALASVDAQTVPVDVIVEEDTEFPGHFVPGGAARTRNRAIAKVETDWIAFLDDDDEFRPFHVERCLAKAKETDADLVYPWWDGANENSFRVPRGPIRVTPEGQQFDDELRDFLCGDCDWQNGADASNFLPVTVLVRTELVQMVGGFPIPGTEEWPHFNSEDHGLWIRLLRAGAKFVHLPQRTWMYHLHTNHLSHA